MKVEKGSVGNKLKETAKETEKKREGGMKKIRREINTEKKYEDNQKRTFKKRERLGKKIRIKKEEEAKRERAKRREKSQ